MAKRKTKDTSVRYPDAVKRAAVRRILSGKSTIEQEATRTGASGTSVRYWVYSAQQATQSEQPLPTKPATSERPTRAKAKALVPTGFACPHCGGAIEVAA